MYLFSSAVVQKQTRVMYAPIHTQNLSESKASFGEDFCICHFLKEWLILSALKLCQKRANTRLIYLANLGKLVLYHPNLGMLANLVS